MLPLLCLWPGQVYMKDLCDSMLLQLGSEMIYKSMNFLPGPPGWS